MSDTEKTIFEKIINKELPANILLENEHAVVIADIHPQAPVHVLIVPKKKITHIHDASENDVYILGKLLLTAQEFAKKHDITDGYRLVINNGKHAQETVPHLHIHLLAGKTMAWPPC